ncbi:protein ILRUN-like [Haliotis cracherodii]|uniref:protein ILRUN-like n=1 Tax=Haliotis cracherodii TaxID=6455 RepID=UPI0039ED6A0C
MDVDNDLDGQLLQQFSSMGTTDRDVLIAEFQKLLGNKLNPSSCAFFLDMNNWNLQEAIGSYYDFEQPPVNLPSMSFIKDVTIGEGESIPPNNKFIKTWRVQNGGTEAWPPGCSLKFCSGDNLSITDRAMVETLQPGQMTDISIEMTSPAQKGTYHGQWRMHTPTGVGFGEVIWVIINVDEGGLLGVTQQLSRFGGEFHKSPTNVVAANPFGSPEKIGHQDGVDSPTREMHSPSHQPHCEGPSNPPLPMPWPGFSVGLSQPPQETPGMMQQLTDHSQDEEMS